MTDHKIINDTDAELKVSVVISNEEYQKEYDNELSVISKTAKLDGFRQGKVPLSVIKKKFDGQCHQKSISNLIEFHTHKINLEKKLDLIDSPSVKLIDTPSNNKNLSFEVTFNKMPDVDINEIKNIKINLPKVVIEQTDVDHVISNIQKQNTVWVDSTMISKSGDKLVVDYEGNINGNEFKNNKQDDFTFVINDTIKGDTATVELFNQFSKECLGKKINDKVIVSNNMPKDFPDKELAGKLVKYDVKIKKILEGTLPELNKDFFGLLGIDTDDVVEFRENVKNHMEFELKDKMVSKKYGLVNEQLVSYFNFTIPEAMVSKHQLELEQQYSALKKSDENIDEKIKEIAIKRVKLNILYIKLAKEVNTTITDQEAIDFSNEQSPSFRQFYSEKLKKEKDSTLMDIKNKMVENAIVEYVIDTASITSINKTFAEAMDE
jgi:trigger factor